MVEEWLLGESFSARRGFDGSNIGKSVAAASLQEIVDNCKDAKWQPNPCFMGNCKCSLLRASKHPSVLDVLSIFLGF